MATAKLNIAVVGAGIGGLCTALFLRRQGHSVTVYEKQSGLSEAGAGIQIPPNASRLLARLGLLSTFREHSFEPRVIQIRRYSDGRILQQLPGSPAAEELTGYPYMLIHRSTYQQILSNASINSQIKLVFGCCISTIDTEAPAVVFRDGTSTAFDLVIGADGVHSLVRQALLGEVVRPPLVHSHRVYRALIDSHLMSSTPLAKDLMDSATVNCWVGPDRHIVAYPISSTKYNIVMTHPGQTADLDSWEQPGSLIEMKQTYADFDEQVRAVLDLVASVRAWTILEAPTLDRWTSDNGKVVLCGDAAHAMLPYAAQGAAQAVEDAAVLSACTGLLSATFDLQSCTEMYVKLRKPRIDKIAAASRINGDLWHAKDGPAQEARDNIYARTVQNRTSGNRQPDAENKNTCEVSSTNPPETDLITWLFQTDVLEDVELATKSVAYSHEA